MNGFHDAMVVGEGDGLRRAVFASIAYGFAVLCVITMRIGWGWQRFG
jgi:hypothetical protein